MAAKNKKEIGSDFLPEEKKLEDVKYGRVLGGIPEQDLSEEIITQEEFDKEFPEKIILNQASEPEEQKETTILEDQQIYEEAIALIESGALTPVDVFPSDVRNEDGTTTSYKTEIYLHKGKKIKASYVFDDASELWVIENIQELKEPKNDDDAFMEEIDDNNVQLPKDPKEAQRRIAKYEADIEKTQDIMAKIKNKAELSSHPGLAELLETNQNNLRESIDENNPKDLNDGRKPWENVLGVIKQTSAYALNYKNYEADIKRLEKQIDAIKNMEGYQNPLPLQAPQEESNIIPIGGKKDYEDYLEKINEMLDQEEYEFATETLEGILEWVEQNNHITEDQIAAIENIEKSVS